MVREEYNHSRPVSALIRDWLLYSKASGGGGILKTVTGNPISISDALAARIKSLSVSLSPIQEGSGDPSPDNVRPITGRDSVTVWRTGINVWDEEWEYGLLNTNGSVGESATRITTKNFVPVIPGESYCMRITMDGRGRGAFYADDKTLLAYYSDFPKTQTPDVFPNNGAITAIGDAWYFTFIAPPGAKWMKYTLYPNAIPDGISINYPSTDNDYHAYDGASVTVQLGQTVYGGTVDVTGGKVHVTHELVDMSTIDWSPYADSSPYSGSAYCYLESTNCTLPEVDDTAVVSNLFIYRGRTAARDTLFSFGFVAVHPYIWLKLYDGEYHTRAEWQAKLAEMGAKVILPLAEPFDIDITPAQLTTLRGDNTVWSDGDSVEMTYKAVSS